jgi:hypothetical protein
MNFYQYGDHKPYTHIIAIGEKSAGNDTVGDMWTETKIFPRETPIEEIIEWAKEIKVNGKLVITISEPEKKEVQ